jgi:hypothetical protein
VRPKDAAERHKDAAADEVTGEILAVVFKACTHAQTRTRTRKHASDRKPLRHTFRLLLACAPPAHSPHTPQVNDRGHIGYATPGGARRYCCSAAVAAELGCTPGRVVVTPHGDDPAWPWTTRVPFRGAAEVALAADAAVTIHVTGMYHLWFMTCDASLAATAVAGHTAWKNPGGYLPGMMAPNLPFFAAMSAAYVCLGVAWMGACVAAWRHVITLQHCISVVLLLVRPALMHAHVAVCVRCMQRLTRRCVRCAREKQGMAEMLTWCVHVACASRVSRFCADARVPFTQVR